MWTWPTLVSLSSSCGDVYTRPSTVGYAAEGPEDWHIFSLRSIWDCPKPLTSSAINKCLNKLWQIASPDDSVSATSLQKSVETHVHRGGPRLGDPLTQTHGAPVGEKPSNLPVPIKSIFQKKRMSFSSVSRNFHSFGDVTINGEGLQILTFTRHSYTLSSEGSLTYHTYCDTGLPFIMVISEDS